MDPRTPTLPREVLTLSVGLAVEFAAFLGIFNVNAWSGFEGLSQVPVTDLLVYREAATRFLAGLPIYGDGFTSLGVHVEWVYPPFALAVALPTLLIPQNQLRLVWTAIAVIPPVIVMLILVRDHVAPRVRTLPFVLLVAGALAGGSVIDLIVTGQVGALLACACVADGVRRDRRWLPRGVLVGLAVAIKLTPGIFIVYWLLTKQSKAAITSMITTFAATLIGFVMLPHDTINFYLRGGFLRSSSYEMQGAHIFQPSNTSINTVLMYLLNSFQVPAWLTVLAMLLVITPALAVAWWLHQHQLEAHAIILAGLSTLLSSPVSWYHYAVWLLPVPVLLLAAAHHQKRIWLQANLMAGTILFLVLNALATATHPAWLWWDHPIFTFLFHKVLIGAGMVATAWAGYTTRKIASLPVHSRDLDLDQRVMPTP